MLGLSFLNCNNIINASQNGFRTHHNTTTAIIDVFDFVTKMKSNNLLVLLLFIDISKAFDSLSHCILLEKLHYYGIRGIVHHWFMNYLKNRYHYVAFSNHKSSLTSIQIGVPQGSTLGPILFLLYVNDIFYIHEKCKLVLFADDTCIAVAADNLNSLVLICRDIFNACSQWFADNILALNVKKLNYMIIAKRNTNRLLYASLPFNGGVINRVQTVKYLGVMLDDNLSWDCHTAYIADKCSKGLGLLKRAHSFCLTNVSFRCIIVLFICICKMLLNYMVVHVICT
jgi:hypothetical protein